MYVLRVISYGVIRVCSSVLAVRMGEPWESKFCRPTLYVECASKFYSTSQLLRHNRRNLDRGSKTCGPLQPDEHFSDFR